MKILVGENAGFCYGVKRAVTGTQNILNQYNDVCCLGELVHNNEVIKELKNQGLTIIENPENALQNTIIRAHGIPTHVYKILKNKNINVFDYTCPNVLKIHQLAEEYANKNYYIFLLGDSHHPENVATISFCGDNSCIIENENQVQMAISKFQESRLQKILIIAQTTFSISKFDYIVESIKQKLSNDIELITKNTICNATEIRQLEVANLSKRVDYMIIVGGKNSSNTKKLFEIAKQNCNHAICVENKSELNLEDFNKFETIGIMSGASTPKESIDEIKEYIYHQ